MKDVIALREVVEKVGGVISKALGRTRNEGKERDKGARFKKSREPLVHQ